MSQPEISFFDPGDGRGIAYKFRPATRPEPLPAILFLPGYASDMDGTKAVALDGFAASNGLAMLRFDYSGCGQSEGEFGDGTLANWLDEAIAISDAILPDSRLLVVGSSMGGWLALQLALRRKEKIHSLVGIAAAPDFTDWALTKEQKSTILREGRLEQPNPYGPEPGVIHGGFFQSSQSLLMLHAAIDIIAPVRLLHGDSDAEVPWSVATRLMQQLRSSDVQLTLIKNGGHRLSEPHEMDVLLRTVGMLLETRR